MKTVNEVSKICYFLIKQCLDTGANEMRVTLNDVTLLKEKLGNWEVIVKKKDNK